MKTVTVSKELLFELLYDMWKDGDLSFDTITLTHNGEDIVPVLNDTKVPYNITNFINLKSLDSWRDKMDDYDDDGCWYFDGQRYDDNSLDDFLVDAFYENIEDVWYKATGFVDGKEVIIDWVS